MLLIFISCCQAEILTNVQFIQNIEAGIADMQSMYIFDEPV